MVSLTQTTSNSVAPIDASDSRARRAFTIVELLVAISVVALLVLLISQLVGRATTMTSDGIKRMDMNGEAQFIFNRMALDFGGIVKRSDVDYYLQKSDGNDQLAFYSLTTGYYPDGVTGQTATSPVCVAGYRVRSNRLERLSKALIWNGVSDDTQSVSSLPAGAFPMVFAPSTLTGTWTQIAATGDDPDYEVISDHVYRLEFRYLLKDGSVSDTPYFGTNTAVNGLRDVSAFIVAIALLDAKSRNIVTDMSTAASALPDPSGADTILKEWQGKLDDADLGLPRAAASQVRFYERYFYLSSAP